MSTTVPTIRNLRKRFAEPEEAILIHISNFRPVKRVEDVIEIFSARPQETQGATC